MPSATPDPGGDPRRESTKASTWSYTNGFIDAANGLHAKLEVLQEGDADLVSEIRAAYTKIDQILTATALGRKIAALSDVLLKMQMVLDIADTAYNLYTVASGIRLSGDSARGLALVGGGELRFAMAAGVQVDGAALATAAMNMSRAGVIMNMSANEGGGAGGAGAGAVAALQPLIRDPKDF
jgi:hypothetical protein